MLNCKKNSMIFLIILLISVFGIDISSVFAGSDLINKRFFCSNPSLGTYDSFSLEGRFIDNETVNIILTLNEFNPICDWGKLTFTAEHDPISGKWLGNNVSFVISTDGYIDNFIYKKYYDSWSECQITLNRLKICGPALPFLHLLLSE